MSYELTFYADSYKKLHDDILRPPDDFRKNLAESWSRVYEPDEGEAAETALEAGMTELAKAVAENKKTRLSTTGELAFVAAIEAHARRLGTLAHSSAGGEEFRREFLDRRAAENFNFPNLGGYLTRRPLYGIVTLEYPSWGCLLAAEIAELENDFRPAPGTKGEFAEWLAELVRFVEQAKKERFDLLTLYR
jgi:hypothetical protein